MGGRGSSSGGGGGGGGGAWVAAYGRFAGYRSIGALVDAKNAVPQNLKTGSNTINNPDPYTDNGNEQLLKYQAQDDDKTARFLANVAKTTDYSNYDDGQYGFYDNSFQKLALRLGIAHPPKEVSDSVFNQYVQQTGSEVFYRGFSSSDSADRLTKANYFHTGTGVYGDGVYFTQDKATAASYGIGYNKGAIRKMTLSPDAKVIDYTTLQRSMASASPNLQSAMRAAGSKGSRSYSGNDGEAQWALKNGYNVVRIGSGKSAYYYALSGDALIVSSRKY